MSTDNVKNTLAAIDWDSEEKDYIDYDSVNAELSKGLLKIDGISDSVWASAASKINTAEFGSILEELRTVRFGGPRQSGLTQWAAGLALLGPQRALVTLATKEAADDFSARLAIINSLLGDENPVSPPLITVGYPDLSKVEEPFDIVIVDDAGKFFTRYNYLVFCANLRGHVSKDVILYRLR